MRALWLCVVVVSFGCERGQPAEGPESVVAVPMVDASSALLTEPGRTPNVSALPPPREPEATIRCSEICSRVGAQCSGVDATRCTRDCDRTLARLSPRCRERLQPLARCLNRDPEIRCGAGTDFDIPECKELIGDMKAGCDDDEDEPTLPPPSP